MKYIYKAILLGGAAFCASQACAQEATDATAGNTRTVGNEEGLAEIIVTAQRQAQSAQRAGIAIAVIQPEAAASVTQPQDITKLAPSVQIGSGGGQTPILYVRGVGTFSANPFTDSAVAFNYDEVYLGRPTSAFGLFYDLERIEVLKGPQGTLYGRNATGGALNVLPAKPKLGLREASGTISIGNYEAVNAQAAVNLPISDKAALRIAGISYTHDGYNSDGTFDEKGTGGRMQLLVEPSEKVSVRIAADYFDLGGTGPTGVLLTGPGGAPTGFAPNVGPYDPRSAAVLGATVVMPASTRLGSAFVRPFTNNIYYGVHMELKADLGFADLTTVGAWRRSDLDHVNNPGSFLVMNTETDEQFSLEARLDGSAGPIDWLVGGMAFKESVDAHFRINMKVLGSVALSETDNTSYAGFGRLTWNVTDQLRLTGAARYTYDKKKMDGLQNQVVGTCTIAGPPPACPNFRFLPGDIRDLNAALASIGFIRPGPAGTPYIDTLGTSGAIYTHNLTVINDSISNDKLTYRIAAEFEPRAGSLLYASRETGYRGGGYTFSTVKPVYDPENITAYTIGAKNRFFDNKLQFNVEAFYWKYKDQQVTHNSFGVTGAPEFVTENIGASTNKGVEFEIVGKPLRNTTLSANIQYLDAKNDSFVFTEIDNSFRANLPPGTVAPTVSGCARSVLPGNLYQIDCSGLRALRSPKWTVNLGAQQVFDLSNGMRLIVDGSTHYQTSSIVMFERRAFAVQKGYWLSSASLTLAAKNDSWSIAAYINNIENTYVYGSSFYNSGVGITQGNYGPPRTYGAKMSFKF